MKINKFNDFLDAVEDALLYSKDTVSCLHGLEKINHALFRLSDIRLETPSREDDGFIEYVCSELANEHELALADQVRLSDENQKSLYFESTAQPTSPIEDLSRNSTLEITQDNSASEQDKRLELIRAELDEDDDFFQSQGEPSFSAGNFGQAINSSSHVSNSAFQADTASDIEVVIDKNKLYKKYISVMIENGHSGASVESIKKSAIFIDNFSHYINSSFSPSMSVDSLIESFAVGGDANKIFGHKKVMGDLILKIPESYFQTSVSRSGHEATKDNIDRVKNCFVSKFVFDKKYSEIMKEALLTLDNDSVIDLLMGFD
ncbi:hypothetical protein F0M16_10705 [Vibrio cholerae]|uniref:Uncharacterized protein n=1 Tax=Vibrio cholerae TaxID=666 RepID=A0A5Q6PIK4_VIBCL|nr:hypothetical protein [Vibrio cholerae]KAA1254728.1 hypothetical protein F0M16_10705 [Vibrio cholerae]